MSVHTGASGRNGVQVPHPNLEEEPSRGGRMLLIVPKEHKFFTSHQTQSLYGPSLD